MSTAGWLALDLLAAVATTAAWLGAGVAAVTGRPRATRVLTGVASVATVTRAVTVAGLARAGLWFVPEKIIIAAPLLLAAMLPIFWVREAKASGAARLTAGSAAAVGLGATLLFGYSAGTWSAALIAAAIAGAAALVTWRILVPDARYLRAGLAATLAVGLSGLGLALLPGAEPATASGTPVTSLRGPAEPAPGGAILRYTLTARTATVTLGSGRRVAAWTFDGQVPGPALTATEGDLVEVTLRNADIAAGVTLHWHGYDVPAGEDGAPGVTQDPVRPGGEFVYRFRADQVGTYWYHTHEVSDRGVRLGLYGTLVVSARGATPTGLDLTLPVHTLGGQLVFGDQDRPVERAVAAGTPVRLRLVNTDSTALRFGLAGTAFRVAAIDGTDLNAPGELTRVALRVPAGGRYDVAFTMPSTPVSLVAAGHPDRGLRLGGGAPTVDPSSWPDFDPLSYGAPAGPGLTRFDRDLTLVLDRGLSGFRYAYTVNGHAYPSIPAQVVREGDVVRMTVVNRDRDPHPWHLHGHRVLVLRRDGRAPTGSPLWMDTFDVRPGEVWQVAFRADNPGVWMNHCHNLAHATQGMALHLTYSGYATPFHGGHGGD